MDNFADAGPPVDGRSSIGQMVERERGIDEFITDAYGCFMAEQRDVRHDGFQIEFGLLG